MNEARNMIDQLVKALDVNYQQLADLIGVTRTMVWKWRNDGFRDEPRLAAKKLIRLFDTVRFIVAFDPDVDPMRVLNGKLYFGQVQKSLIETIIENPTAPEFKQLTFVAIKNTHLVYDEDMR
jgi:transcriptional regulator with XRE-family HTH domain